jgi:hypothetical protein
MKGRFWILDFGFWICDLRFAGVVTWLAISAHGAANLLVEGEYQSEDGGVATEFVAVMGREAIRIQWNQEAVDSLWTERYGLPASRRPQWTSYVDSKVSVIFGPPSAPDTLSVGIRGSEHAWGLGSIGASIQNRIFVLLRAVELFPAPDGTGRRRMSPTWELGEDPAGLVTEAQYWFESGNLDREFRAELIPVESLLRSWRESPYLARHPGWERRRAGEIVDEWIVLPTQKLLGRPAMREGERMRLELGQLARMLEQDLEGMEPGKMIESFRFHSFTNVGGIEIPTVGEFTRFKHRPGAQMGGTGMAERGTNRVIVRRVYATVEDPSILPLRAAQIHVSDHRLVHPGLGVIGVRYQTNELVTFEVTDAAIAAFESAKAQAWGLHRAAWRERVFILAAWTLVLLAPFLGSWWWFGGRSVSRSARQGAGD